MTTERRRKPRATPLPITTLAINERVIVNLKVRQLSDHVHQYGGRVVAVDGLAVRLEVDWYRMALSVVSSFGERVFPWWRIEDISIEEER